MLALQGETDEHHDAGPAEPLQGRHRLLGVAGLGEHLHVGTVGDQPAEARAHDGQGVDQHDPESPPDGGG